MSYYYNSNTIQRSMLFLSLDRSFLTQLCYIYVPDFFLSEHNTANTKYSTNYKKDWNAYFREYYVIYNMGTRYIANIIFYIIVQWIDHLYIFYCTWRIIRNHRALKCTLKDQICETYIQCTGVWNNVYCFLSVYTILFREHITCLQETGMEVIEFDLVTLTIIQLRIYCRFVQTHYYIFSKKTQQ